MLIKDEVPTMKLIDVEHINYYEDELVSFLKKIDTETSYQIHTLIYYPYILFEYSLRHEKKSWKNFFRPIGTTAGCTIDAINQLGALIDRSPLLKKQMISNQRILNHTLDVNEGRSIAKNFVQEAIASRLKIFSMPQLKLIHEKIFYRPYWVVNGFKSSHSFSLTIDAVSGRYHPL